LIGVKPTARSSQRDARFPDQNRNRQNRRGGGR